jgi:hypothetical protein
MSVSAHGDREALFFDYYSGTQKNIFPLNEACTRPLGH